MNKIVIKLIKIYQNTPTNMHNACRFTPTCSNYALEAFENFNFFKASYLTIRRLLKCRPFGKYGYDPVPIGGNNNYDKKNK
jgi:putative membrane protein insertion efficiency factor